MMKNKINLKHLFLGLTLSFSFISCVFADFSVREDKQSLENYTDVKNPCYHRAVIGGPSILDDYHVFPIQENNRYFGRISFNSGIYILSALKNKSTSSADIQGQIVRESQTKTNPGVEFAFGYIWSPKIRGEVEYLLIRNLNYSPNPLFSNVAIQRSFNAALKNNTLLANIYYDFGYYTRFRPFITFGVGVAVNSVTSSISPVPTNAVVIDGPKQMAALALAGGLGFRVHMFPRWFANLSYRYINFGVTRMQPTNNITVEANYSTSLFSLGLSYIF